MTCQEVERDELAERYVLGQLGDREQAAFEDHYFDCAACLEHVRALQDVREELSAPTAAVRPRRWPRTVAAIAAAAALVLAVRVGQQMWTEPVLPPSSAPRPDIVLPAPPAQTTIALPPYTPPRLRGVPSEAQRLFEAAMVSYRAGNCAAATPGLQRALEADGSVIRARFYLAACDLHENRVTEGVTNLRSVIDAGESPYLEDAHFLLAQARMQQGDLAAAREELRQVIALKGDRLEEARRLLDKLQ